MSIYDIDTKVLQIQKTLKTTECASTVSCCALFESYKSSEELLLGW
ncbi:MAG: hypothetical protein ACTS7E_02610 [Arsenophonus sp. NC-CH8-MAG3]